MNFAFPAALWALPLALVPPILHLISRRTARRVRFSDLTLLKSVESRARPKRRLREALLAASRALLIAALVLAAAGPSRRGDASGAEGLDLVVLLDASWSMRARDGGRARFDLAREAGLRLLRRLASSDRVAVGVYDESLKAPLAWTTPAAAEGALSAARPGWRGTDAGAALAAAGRLLASSPPGRRRAVVVLGDGAAHALAGAPASAPEGAAAAGLRFPALANAGLAAPAPAPGSSPRAPRLLARYAAFGAPASAPVDAWVGERRAGAATLSARAGEEARAPLALPPPEDPKAPAWHGRLAARPDALAADDEAFFSFAHRPAPRVLVLFSDPGFFRAGRAGWFLRQAFGAGGESVVGREADFLEAARWEEADLRRYGAVLLPDAARPAPGLADALRRFAENGGGVIVVPGAETGAEDLAPYAGWLSARFGAAFSPAPGGPRATREGEAVEGWSQLELARVGFARALALEPAAGAAAWAADAAGAPLLVAGGVGRGRAVAWAAPLDARSSNLGLKPFFVPWLTACLALSVPPGAGGEASRAARVGEPLTRAWAPEEAAPERVSVRLPEGRRVALPVTGRRATLAEAPGPGLYFFEEPSGRSTAFAVNLETGRGEGDLSPAEDPPWRAAPPEGFEEFALDLIYGKDLGAAFLALAALLLAAEMLLALPARGAAALALLLLHPGFARAQQGDRFVWTQLKLGEDWDPYPDAPESVAARLGAATSVRAAPKRRAITLTDPALFSSPFLYLAGQSAPPPLTEEEVRRLRQFVSGGGFLWIEDAGGGPPGSFDRWVRRELGRVLPESPLKPLPSSHVLYRSFFLLRGPAGRLRVHGAAEGVDWGGRVAALYTRDDALGAWAKDALGAPLKPCVPGGEAQRELARRFTLNAVLYSLTGSYKSDAVHQAALLEKLKAVSP